MIHIRIEEKRFMFYARDLGRWKVTGPHDGRFNRDVASALDFLAWLNWPGQSSWAEVGRLNWPRGSCKLTERIISPAVRTGLFLVILPIVSVSLPQKSPVRTRLFTVVQTGRCCLRLDLLSASHGSCSVLLDAEFVQIRLNNLCMQAIAANYSNASAHSCVFKYNDWNTVTVYEFAPRITTCRYFGQQNQVGHL